MRERERERERENGIYTTIIHGYKVYIAIFRTRNTKDSVFTSHSLELPDPYS